MNLTARNRSFAVAIEPSRLLRSKLRAVRRKCLLVGVINAVAAAVGVMVVGLLLEMGLDWWIELPRLCRAGALLATIAAAAYVAWRTALVRLGAQLDEDTVALQVERGFPQFRGRLIAAVQLTRPGAADPQTHAALLRRLLEQTEELAAAVNFGRAVPMGAMAARVLLAVLVTLAGWGTIRLVGNSGTELLRRALLADVSLSPKTQVICLSGDGKIARGDTVRLEARACGIIPKGGRVSIQPDHGEMCWYAMSPDPQDRSRFVLTMENVQESFAYSVSLNDGSSGPYRIEVQPPPVITALQCQQLYPQYTQLGTVTQPISNLRLLVGSELELRLTASKPLRSAVLRLVGLSRELPMTLDAVDRRRASIRLPVPAEQLQGISVHLVDEEGFESQNDPVYPVAIVRDEPPVVAITRPKREEEPIGADGSVFVEWEAVDDYGIGAVALHYALDAAPDATPGKLEMDIGQPLPRMVQRSFQWDVGSLRAAATVEVQSIEFWLEVRDNNDVGGPAASTSKRHRLRFVSESEGSPWLQAERSDGPGQTLAALEQVREKMTRLILQQQQLELLTARMVGASTRVSGADATNSFMAQRQLAENVRTLLRGWPAAVANAVPLVEAAANLLSEAAAQLMRADAAAAWMQQRDAVEKLCQALAVVDSELVRTQERLGQRYSDLDSRLASILLQLAHVRALVERAMSQLVERGTSADAALAAQALERAADRTGRVSVERLLAQAATARENLQQARQALATAVVQAAVNQAALALTHAAAAQRALTQASDALASVRAAPGTAVASSAQATHATSVAAMQFTFAREAEWDVPTEGLANAEAEEAVGAGRRAAASVGLHEHDRKVVEQWRSEKYPEEYGPLIEQYFRNLADCALFSP